MSCREERDVLPGRKPPKRPLWRPGSKQCRHGERDDKVAGVHRISKAVSLRVVDETRTHKNHRSAVAMDMPMPRTYSGNASAEYWASHQNGAATRMKAGPSLRLVTYSKGYRSFSGRIRSREEVNAEGDDPNMRWTRRGYPTTYRCMSDTKNENAVPLLLTMQSPS